MKEGYDDMQRYRRDKEANSQTYVRVDRDSTEEVMSSNLRVGDIVEINGN
jgi:phospholipid-translocating ATPase